MVEGKKMALIPLDMLHRLNKPDLTLIKNPAQDQLVKTMGEMSNVLHDNSLPDDIKSSRYNEKIKDFTVYADRITSGNVPPPPIHPTKVSPVNQKFYSLPKSFQQPANVLLKELEKYPDRVQWNDHTNELTIDGKQLVGSNLIDLVGDVLRNRKTVPPPMHSDTFLQILADMNIPEELIRNKSRVAPYRAHKRFDNSTTSSIDFQPSPKFDIEKERREKLAKIRKIKLQKKLQLSNLKRMYKWKNV